jgi:hypothetical protein
MGNTTFFHLDNCSIEEIEHMDTHEKRNPKANTVVQIDRVRGQFDYPIIEEIEHMDTHEKRNH